MEDSQLRGARDARSRREEKGKVGLCGHCRAVCFSQGGEEASGNAQRSLFSCFCPFSRAPLVLFFFFFPSLSPSLSYFCQGDFDPLVSRSLCDRGFGWLGSCLSRSGARGASCAPRDVRSRRDASPGRVAGGRAGRAVRFRLSPRASLSICDGDAGRAREGRRRRGDGGRRGGCDEPLWARGAPARRPARGPPRRSAHADSLCVSRVAVVDSAGFATARRREHRCVLQPRLELCLCRAVESRGGAPGRGRRWRSACATQNGILLAAARVGTRHSPRRRCK